MCLLHEKKKKKYETWKCLRSSGLFRSQGGNFQTEAATASSSAIKRGVARAATRLCLRFVLPFTRPTVRTLIVDDTSSSANGRLLPFPDAIPPSFFSLFDSLFGHLSLFPCLILQRLARVRILEQALRRDDTSCASPFARLFRPICIFFGVVFRRASWFAGVVNMGRFRRSSGVG